MTLFPAVSTAPVAGLGPCAARALTAEVARHNVATSALVVRADHCSTVVAAAVEALKRGR